MSIAPEMSAQLFSHLGPEKVQAVTLEITQLPMISVEVRNSVITEYFDGLNWDVSGLLIKDVGSWAVLETFVRQQPRVAADILIRKWLGDVGPEHAESISVPLTPTQKAAVLFMSVDPERAGHLFSELGPEEVQAITLEITQLPNITPEVRTSVIDEFLEGVSWDVAGLSVSGLGTLAVLEAFVSHQPKAAAELLTSRWLDSVRQVNFVKKAAMFLQSLPLPLVNNLMGCFSPEERSSLLRSMEKQGALKSCVSEAAWVELMAPEAVAVGDGFDVSKLWKALVKMIRKEPEVVIERIRQRWRTRPSQYS